MPELAISSQRRDIMCWALLLVVLALALACIGSCMVRCFPASDGADGKGKRAPCCFGDRGENGDGRESIIERKE